MKVLSGRSSNPASGDLFFLGHSFTLTDTLHWAGIRMIITGVDSNPRILEPISFIILEL